MQINSFSDLLVAARQQVEPQRLLFVFVKAEVTKQADAAHGQTGGYLNPVVCVDKLPEEIASFADLVRESKNTGVEWDMVFIASMSGRAGFAPNSDEAAQALKMMVEAVQGGRISNFICCDLNGELVSFY